MSRTRQLFDEASGLQGAERDRFLDEQCGQDRGLRQQVEDLLRLDAASDFLAEGRLQRLRAEVSGVDELPEQIGPFRVLARLGHGGMGIVYRAQQAEPRREVAVKVLAGSIVTPAARARFAFEAEALGRLQHPGIAQIFAADVLQSSHGSQPYLVMELVRGEPLSGWARRTRPSIAEMLRLLLEVADAVHHAHLRSVIHRDLKPANVLVDDRGTAKVLDFGVARLIDGGPESAAPTQAGQVLGTLAYMSPEQAGGDGVAIDARSDVYSLGVIGYELLAGVLPIDVGTDAITKGLQRVVTEEPRRLGAIDTRLRGDLETIFACALQKDPQRRYASMAAFAEDLRRHLAHEPIRARPATFAYVASRFARRHALALFAVAAVFVGLVVALVASLQATARIEEARSREATARQEADAKAAAAQREEQLKSDVLGVLGNLLRTMNPLADPAARSESVGARLEQALSKFEARLGESPLTERRIRQEMATLLSGRGEYAAAIVQQRRVCDLFAGESSAAAEYAAFLLAKAQNNNHDYNAALATLDHLGRDRVDTHPRALAHQEVLRAQVLAGLSRRDEARELWQSAIERCVDEPSLAESEVLACARLQLADDLLRDGRIDDAMPLIDAALPLTQKGQDTSVMLSLSAINMQVTLAHRQKRFDVALRLADSLVVAWQRVFGPEHPAMAALVNNRAAALRGLGRHDEAIAAFEQAIDLVRRAHGDDSLQAGPFHANLARLLLDLKRPEAAAEHLARAIELREQHHTAPDRNLAMYIHDLARIRREQGRLAEALALLRRGVVVRTAVHGESAVETLLGRMDLAEALGAAGEVAAALAELRAVDAVVVPAFATHEAAGRAAGLLAEFLLRSGEVDAVPAAIRCLRERSHGTTWQAAAERAAVRLETELQRRRK